MCLKAETISILSCTFCFDSAIFIYLNFYAAK